MMTRPWTVWAAQDSRYFLLWHGESIGGPGYKDCVEANRECDRRNAKDERWRILRNKEERQSRRGD